MYGLLDWYSSRRGRGRVRHALLRRVRRKRAAAVITDFRSAAAINAAVGNAFVQLADGRLDPRRAAVLTYMAQLLFQTLKKVHWEGIERSPTPNLEKALKASLKASVSKSEADKLIGQIYAAALEEGGPGALNLK